MIRLRIFLSLKMLYTTEARQDRDSASKLHHKREFSSATTADVSRMGHSGATWHVTADGFRIPNHTLRTKGTPADELPGLHACSVKEHRYDAHPPPVCGPQVLTHEPRWHLLHFQQMLAVFYQDE